MNFVELMLLISERGEKIIQDKSNLIQTDKNIYEREAPGSAFWIQKELPVSSEDVKEI